MATSRRAGAYGAKSPRPCVAELYDEATQTQLETTNLKYLYAITSTAEETYRKPVAFISVYFTANEWYSYPAGKHVYTNIEQRYAQRNAVPGVKPQTPEEAYNIFCQLYEHGLTNP